MGRNNMANNNEQKSILEVFGSKSQDGDKVKGLLLNALMRNSYKNGGEVPIQQSLNVASPEYEGIIPLERRVTQHATPRQGVEGYFDMSKIEFAPEEDISGLLGLLQRLLPGGKTGKKSRKMTNKEKEEVYRREAYNKPLPKSNPYYEFYNEED